MPEESTGAVVAYKARLYSQMTVLDEDDEGQDAQDAQEGQEEEGQNGD